MKDAFTQAGDGLGVQALSSMPLKEFEFPQFLYRKHPFAILAVSLLAIYIVAFGVETEEALKTGFWCGLLTVIIVCSLNLPDNEFISRPHPAFWRGLQGAAICYQGLLIFMLFQTTDNARQLMSYLDPRLGVPLPEKDYASDCRVFTPEDSESLFRNIKDVFWDCYIPAHFLGWYVKMLIIRDVRLCWVCSLIFEFMEITLRHQLPNFWECWWDSLIFDVLLCNGVGIYLGYLTCSFFNMKQYYWGMGPDDRAEDGRFTGVSRSAIQLTPFSWMSYNWDLFASPKNFLGTLFYILFVNLVDLSHFYLKFGLWIPANNWLLFVRVFFWGIFAILATREYFEFFRGAATLGSNTILATTLIASEWALSCKHNQGMFTEPMPEWLLAIWSTIVAVLLAVGVYLSLKPRNK
jgi:phosphatidylserine synthase 2